MAEDTPEGEQVETPTDDYKHPTVLDQTIADSIEESNYEPEPTGQFDEPEEIEPTEDEPVAEASESEGDNEPSTEETSEAQTPEISDDIAPQGLNASQREIFDKLDADGQQILTDLAKAQQADYTRKTQGIAEERKFAEQYGDFLKDTEQELIQRQLGISPTEYLSRLRNTEKLLMFGTPEQKIAAHAKLVQDYNIPVQQAQQQTQDRYGQQDVFSDPEMTALRQEVGGLTNQMQMIQNQPRVEAYRNQMSVYEEFTSAKDESGNSTHPHLEAVEENMAFFLRNPNISQTLDTDPKAAFQTAYEWAVTADPALRQSFMESQGVAATDKANSERKARVARAGKGKQIKSSSRPSASRKVETVRDAISAAMEETGYEVTQ